MFIIRKPKYKVCASSKNELDILINETKQNYQKLYPNSVINITVEPNMESINFDGTVKEFIYRAEIKFNE
ncbi:hypothetical protein JK636_11050 [Clostridium sp. YIM B02515]|uniref:DUF4318 domain-containing protein n=1 Tax=Clostridium rhizosphaerae TaxID=2803861 RepID=A0ABS1TB13_9CLOT|nr:hypothetical protein [Clostridium rhizosphaerae]MBL4936297.1 hypothetical protein [Clostridium rhizosphaerae]